MIKIGVLEIVQESYLSSLELTDLLIEWYINDKRSVLKPQCFHFSKFFRVEDTSWGAENVNGFETINPLFSISLKKSEILVNGYFHMMMAMIRYFNKKIVLSSLKRKLYSSEKGPKTVHHTLNDYQNKNPKYFIKLIQKRGKNTIIDWYEFGSWMIWRVLGDRSCFTCIILFFFSVSSLSSSAHPSIARINVLFKIEWINLPVVCHQQNDHIRWGCRSESVKSIQVLIPIFLYK